MARPICPKCDNPTFQITEIEPIDGKYKLNAIHCAKCGAVVGVKEFYNLGQLIYDLAKKLNVKL
jgi:predicted nucleic-acid-binding Zn-ribbon protein